MLNLQQIFPFFGPEVEESHSACCVYRSKHGCFTCQSVCSSLEIELNRPNYESAIKGRRRLRKEPVFVISSYDLDTEVG